MVQETLLYVISLLFAVMLLVILGLKLKIAYPIFLVIGGLLISLIPGTPRVGISPDLIFLIFLPPLLYEAAWYTSWPNFWKMRLPIILHGFGLVIVTSVIIAYLSEKLIPRFTLSIGLLLGGIISPPDAVAASSVLKYFKIPKKVKTVLEGESLVNDAASLTVFRFALAAVISGTFVVEKAAGAFVMVTVMGIFFGLVIAQIIFFIHKLFSTTTEIATALTLITPYIMYLTAEHFHYSGVLAVVSGGLFLSSRSKEILNHKARLQSAGVWHTVAFILNGLIFILIGLQLPSIISGLKYYSIQDGIRYGLVVSRTYHHHSDGLAFCYNLYTYFPQQEIQGKSYASKLERSVPGRLGRHAGCYFAGICIGHPGNPGGWEGISGAGPGFIYQFYGYPGHPGFPGAVAAMDHKEIESQRGHPRNTDGCTGPTDTSETDETFTGQVNR